MCNIEENLFFDSFSGLVEEYRRAIKKFMRMDRFGLEMGRERKKKGRPIHQNTRRNPRSWTNNWSKDGKRRYRKPALLRPWDMYKHLTGQRAFFLKNRYDRRIALYALDIDGEPGTDYEKTAEFARQILTSFFPNVGVFIEPGRSYPEKGGCYVWFLVDWGSTQPPVRNAFENAFNRLLKKKFPKDQGPEGIHFDRLAGQVTYDIPNPHFDADYADEICTRRCVEEVLVQDDPNPEQQRWISRKDAEKLNRKLPGFVPIDAPVRERWVEIKRKEYYEIQKIFYGIGYDNEVAPEARFPFDPRLEEKRTHFGSLVTAPCFATLCGDRPNNLAEFLEWENSKSGKITRKQIEKILPQNELGQILYIEKRLLDGETASISGDVEPIDEDDDRDSTVFSSLPIPSRENTQVKGIDAIRLQPDGDCWLGKNAAGRSALRQTHGDRKAAVPLAVQLYEASGLATGMNEADRADRFYEAERCVEYASRTFNSKTLKKSSESIWFDQVEDVNEMAMRLRGRISKRMLEQASVHQTLTYHKVAHVVCWMIKNIITGNPGEVPFSGFATGLACHGASMSNSAIAQVIRLLIEGQMIQVVKEYGPGRCRHYRFHAHAIIPQWAMPYITESHYERDPRIDNHIAKAHITRPARFPKQRAYGNSCVPGSPSSPPPFGKKYFGNNPEVICNESDGGGASQARNKMKFEWEIQNAQMSL